MHRQSFKSFFFQSFRSEWVYFPQLKQLNVASASVSPHKPWSSDSGCGPLKALRRWIITPAQSWAEASQAVPLIHSLARSPDSGEPGRPAATTPGWKWSSIDIYNAPSPSPPGGSTSISPSFCAALSLRDWKQKAQRKNAGTGFKKEEEKKDSGQDDLMNTAALKWYKYSFCLSDCDSQGAPDQGFKTHTKP